MSQGERVVDDGRIDRVWTRGAESESGACKTRYSGIQTTAFVVAAERLNRNYSG